MHILYGVPSTPGCYRAPRVCCRYASRISFPRLLWFCGCATHATPCFVLGYSYFTMCSEKSEHNCLTSYWYVAAILRSFFFSRVFKGVLSVELVDQEQKNANGNQQKTHLEASKPPTYFTTALKGHPLCCNVGSRYRPWRREFCRCRKFTAV